MKKKIWLAALSLVVLGMIIGLAGCTSGPNVRGAELTGLGVNIKNQQEGIWVNGQGEVYAPPDIATLRLGIESQEKTVADAQSKAADAMDKVMSALTGNGVAKKDIQTQSFSIVQVAQFNKDTNQEIVIGYRVTNLVVAKIRTIDKVGQVIDAVASAGGDLTRIQGISFSIENPTSLNEEARQKAMADAKAKADQLARLGGVKLGAPTYISESTQSQPISQEFYRSAVPAPMPTIQTPISAGEMKIIVNVQLVYSIAE